MGLKFIIRGLRFRTTNNTANNTARWRRIRQGLSNPNPRKLRRGNNPADAGRILSQRQLPGLTVSALETGKISEAEGIADKPPIEIPEMIDIPGMAGKRIMENEVTVALFKQVMEEYKEEYEITGYNAEKLQDILADPSRAGEALTCVSLDDAREFAKRLSNLTGRSFRVQTKEEWAAAKDKLSGDNWTWTETKYKNNNRDIFILRRLGRSYHFLNKRKNRYLWAAIRLVEIIGEDIAA